MPKTDYTHPVRKWTKESIIAIIQANTHGGYCKSTDVGMSVTTMAKRLFGSFDAALLASGSRLWASKPKEAHCTAPGCDKPTRSQHATHCETHYYRLRRNGILGTTIDTAQYAECAYCGTPANGRKFCNATCRSREKRGKPLVAPCRMCAMEFNPKNKSVCCSDACYEEFHRKASRDWYARAMLTMEHRTKVRRAEYKRKALKVSAFVEHVDLSVVFRRDKGMCWLCGERVDLALKWPDAKFASLDHVVPLALGGMHSYGNIKLAHLSCNCRKGMKLVVKASMSGVPAATVGQASLF